MRVLTAVEAAFLNQRGHLFLWSPICLAIGIGLYFALRFEPGLQIYAALVVLSAVMAAMGRRLPEAWAPLAWGMVLIAVGFAVAGFRTHKVAEPVLQWRYYGPVEGRVVSLDRSASDALRVTLDQVRLGDVPVYDRPARIRLSVHGESVQLAPGQRIMTTAHLSPPQGPVEPGGFDFRRHAWFQKLGAVGYSRNPIMTIHPPSADLGGLHVTSLRFAISDRVQSELSGDVGGFTAAVTTGDRSAIGQATLENLRVSNLAHLLAISGLHMGLLTGFVFVACRVLLSLVPFLALRLPVRKIAAVCALVTATGYLLLSGGAVATERAFVMVSVMLGAVLLDRRAISLRAVAVAGLIILVLRPESLLSPGFQMSFAATTALVAVFGGIRDAQIPLGPKWLRPATALLFSSFIAGLATAPIGAAHFNTVSHYGLLANILSVPVMGSVVIPAAVMAALLAPFGLDWIALNLMGLGLGWILGVAEWVSGLDGARGFVPSPPKFVLPMIASGALWCILWQGRSRWFGIASIIFAISFWGQGDRPEVLVADTGGLIGVMTQNGRALSKAKGSGFVASVWLENDGDGADQPTAASRWPVGQSGVRRYSLGDRELIHLVGKRAVSEFLVCSENQIVISSIQIKFTDSCTVFDPDDLQQTGSLAFKHGKIVTSAQVSGVRLWSPRLVTR